MISSYTTTGFGITLVFVGSVRKAGTQETICRGSYELRSYAELITEKERLIGAILINRTQELGLISQLIQKKFLVTDQRNKLENPNYDLKKLIT